MESLTQSDLLMRLAILETKVQAIMASDERDRIFQNDVSLKLALIIRSQESFDQYQKSCEAERIALGKRVTTLENDFKNENEKAQINWAWIAAISLSVSSFLAWAVPIIISWFHHG